MREKYLQRLGDRLLREQLESSGAVLIEGAKWCGKTRMGEEAARSVLYMQDPDNVDSYLNWAGTKPSILLRGETPRLIDEWQMAPVLWDAVRFYIDREGGTGHFILTGSATPQDDGRSHTGTGRISRMLLRPMTLFESQESTGEVSLAALFAGQTEVEGLSSLSVERLAYLICRGGWPEAVLAKSETVALRMAYNYVETVVNSDVQRVDGVERNPARVRQLLRSLARNISTMATMATLKGDVIANDVSISDNTLAGYLNALRRIFLVEDVPAWQPSLRSKTAIRTGEKRQLVDPSIAVAVQKADPESIMRDFNYFGFLFESLVTRDLRVYAQANEGEVWHYRDRNDLEADLVIRLHDGRWAPVEVKLGSREIDEGARHLLELSRKVDTDKVGAPSFLMIVTGGQMAYRRPDGVLVVPLGCLCP